MTNYSTDNASFEALPIEVVNSELTASQLKTLEVLYLYNGLDKTMENGHFFISNDDLMRSAGVSSKSTLSKVIRLFTSLGFIKRKTGTLANRQASEYILHEDVIMEWCKTHPRKEGKKMKTTSSNQEDKQLRKIVEEVIAPLIDNQLELIRTVECLKAEIESLRKDLLVHPTCTPVIKCTTDTEADIDIENKINKGTDSTANRQDAANIRQVAKRNQYDIKLDELTRAVEEFKRTPSWESKKTISGVIERIKAIHQQGGCSLKQLNLAYAIQKDINNIKLPRGSVAAKTVTVPSTSVPSSNFSTSSAQANTITYGKPSATESDSLLTLINQANYFKQSNYDALIQWLSQYDVPTRQEYIDKYIYATHPDFGLEALERKKEAYKRLGIQYPNSVPPAQPTLSSSRAGLQMENVFTV